MPQYVLPDAKSVKKILAMMYGNDLTVTKRDDPDVDPMQVATFVADDGSLVAVCACSPQFVGYSGAALTMLPGGVAKEMIAAGKFNDTVLENFYEVMNVCSSLLMSDTSPHLRLDKTLASEDAATAMAAVSDDADVIAFDVDIPRYGKGGFVFRVC